MTNEEFKKKCEAHDWTYYFSDDHGVFLIGEATSNRLLAEAKQDDGFKRIYNQAFAKVFHKPPFTPPYKLPFPDLST